MMSYQKQERFRSFLCTNCRQMPHRIHLDHFKNPTEAARIVKESNSIEGAKMIAK